MHTTTTKDQEGATTMTDQSTTRITLDLTEQDVDRLRDALVTRYAFLTEQRDRSLSDEARAAFDAELVAIDDIIRDLRVAVLESR